MRHAMGAVILALSCALVTGCASLPQNSTPQVLGSVNRNPGKASPAPPPPNAEPAQLLDGFFSASADSTNRHLAARGYLTPRASAGWDDFSSVTIIDKPDVLPQLRTSDRAEYGIRAQRKGRLTPDGVFAPADGVYDARIVLVRHDGQWRIDELPAGIVLQESLFMERERFRRTPLYFLDLSGRMTVVDARWLDMTDKEQLAARLVDLLAAGPQPALAPAVRNMLGQGKAMPRGKVTPVVGVGPPGTGSAGVKVDFAGAANLDQRARMQLAAQVIWTLADAGVNGPYQLLADGKPLDERFPAGMNKEAVAELSPLNKARNTIGLHAIYGGALVSVSGSRTPLPGFFGGVGSLRSAAFSRDGNLIAAVGDALRTPNSRRVLMVGTYDSNAISVAEGATITRPTWSADDGAAWAVVDGTQVIRAVRDRATGQVSRANVDSSALAGRGRIITELRLSRDGARAAIIMDGKVFVAMVVPLTGGGYALRNPAPVAESLGAPAVSLDWRDGDSMVIARDAPSYPLWSAVADGSELIALNSSNLTGKVGIVAVSAFTKLVTNAGSVFILNEENPAAERYWKQVPGLADGNAIPVLPG